MRHRGCLTLLLFTVCTAGRAETPAKPSIPGSPFVLNVHCPRNPQCIQSNEQLRLVISVTNRSDRDAYLTVDYMRATGPYSTITETGTEEALFGHTSLALDELLSRYQRLGPSEFDFRICWATTNYASTGGDPSARRCGATSTSTPAGGGSRTAAIASTTRASLSYQAAASQLCTDIRRGAGARNQPSRKIPDQHPR